MRKGSYKRKTNETDIAVSINIDGSGRAAIQTGIGFLDHMLAAFALHGGFDLTVRLRGDLEVDSHHTVEDLGICLGMAIKNGLGEIRGIRRAGFFIMPMDESLATVAVDLCGRPYLRLDCPFTQPTVGTMPTGLVHDFLLALATSLTAAIHVKVENGRSAHHQCEALFKSLSRALREACRIVPAAKSRVPSTKGAL